MLKHQKEIYWRQRSRAKWLHEGDRNTRCFHKKNSISRLQDASEVWRESKEEMVPILEDYFTNIFQSYKPREEEIERVTRAISCLFNVDEVAQLDAIFSGEEV